MSNENHIPPGGNPDVLEAPVKEDTTTDTQQQAPLPETLKNSLAGKKKDTSKAAAKGVTPASSPAADQKTSQPQSPTPTQGKASPTKNPRPRSTAPLLILLICMCILLGIGSAYALYLLSDARQLLRHYEDRLEVLESKTDKMPLYNKAADQQDEPEDKQKENTLETEFESVALRARLVEMDDRVASLEQKVATKIETSIQRNKTLTAILDLRERIRSASPFVDELNAVRRLATDDPGILLPASMLEPYATDGIPTLDTLRSDFTERARDIIIADSVPDEEAGVLDHLKNNLNRVVTVRRVGDNVDGNEPDAVVARAETALRSGNVEGAAAELQLLEGAPAEAAKPWLENAAAYMLADKVFNTIYTHVTGRDQEATSTDEPYSEYPLQEPAIKKEIGGTTDNTSKAPMKGFRPDLWEKPANQPEENKTETQPAPKVVVPTTVKKQPTAPTPNINSIPQQPTAAPAPAPTEEAQPSPVNGSNFEHVEEQ